MAKWTSALFSDIRNKLANQVVFGSWKGRGYFRQWVVPTNPQTAPQTAVRAVMADLVALYKSEVDDGPKNSAWNVLGLPQLISGYNFFVQIGKKSWLAAAGGGDSGDIDITYTLGFSSAYAALYRTDDNGANLTIVAAAGVLSDIPDSVVEDTGLTPDDFYKYYIADSRVLVSPDAAPQDYQMVTHWKADKTAGTSVAARAAATT